MAVTPNADFNGRANSPSKLYLRTSGSMGASKIVVHSHAGMIGNAENCIAKYGFGPASRATIPVPIAHMYGFGAEFLPAALAGCSIDLQDKTNLLKYLDREKKFEPTIVFATPAICDMLAKGYKKPRTNYDVFVTSGQRISEELFRNFDALVSGRLVNQYGSTEMGATAAANPGDPLDARATTIGKPMGGVQLMVTSQGELHCLHPYGFEGYLDEDGGWISRSEPGAWYRTGDLAIVQPDGEIVVTGRADASVNRSGYLVLLSDVERVMEKIEAVGEVAVVPAAGEGSRGQRIAAFCVARPGFEADATAIRERCFQLLPHYAIPDVVKVLPSLPLLASAKIDRRTLSALADSPE
jgi:acyl-coenzyme A synthetase/AMP-(fatty) acid ligase